MDSLIFRITIFIFYDFLSNKATAEEPKCYSRFDYDKKMIEEMIRAEIKQEEFAKRMDLNDATLGDLRTDFQKLNDFIQEHVTDTTDGGWSDWSSWNTCPATCGVSTVTRSRSCDNPAPMKFGRQCVGNDQEWKSCEVEKCQDDDARIAFNAKLSSVISQTSYGQTIVFDAITVNQGNSYSPSTGQFTAPLGGTYQFSFSIMFMATRSTTTMYNFILKKGSTDVVYSHSDTHSGRHGYSQSSVNYIIDLKKGEHVYVKSESSGCYIFATHFTFFSGLLLF